LVLETAMDEFVDVGELRADPHVVAAVTQLPGFGPPSRPHSVWE
jgi:hypothetical protein